MPVRARAVVKRRPPASDNPAVMAELEEAFKAAGLLPYDALRDRIAALVVLDRPFTDDERREFKHLVRNWRQREAARVARARRGAKARERWAAFSPAERAEWERRSIDEARRYDRNLERGHPTGEEHHYMHVVFQYDKHERREAKALARRQSKRAAEAERTPQRAAAMVDDQAQPSPRAEGATTPVLVAEPLDPAPLRRPRVKVGIVAEFDAYGRRIR